MFSWHSCRRRLVVVSDCGVDWGAAVGWLFSLLNFKNQLNGTTPHTPYLRNNYGGAIQEAEESSSFPGYLASFISILKEKLIKTLSFRGWKWSWKLADDVPIGQMVSIQTREFSAWQPTCKYNHDGFDNCLARSEPPPPAHATAHTLS